MPGITSIVHTPLTAAQLKELRQQAITAASLGIATANQQQILVDFLISLQFELVLHEDSCIPPERSPP